MGEEKYGDSILFQFGDKLILIDGGHLYDDKPRGGYPSLPDQLKQLSGRWPLALDLLVVTHCHADHIGCLPQLVARGEITAKWALVADPRLGWGKLGRIPGSTDWDSAESLGREHSIVTALFDDRPLADLGDARLAGILADAAGLWDKYTGMLDRLAKDGTKVVRYGVDSHAALVKAFAECGLRILGPTKAHLLKCAKYLAKVGRDALDDLEHAAGVDAAADSVHLLRRLLAQPLASADGSGGPGAALNSQSIVLTFEVNGHRLLLTGDMQFAAADIPGLETDMQALREIVRKAGPYAVVKTPHHTANNGVSSSLLADWGPTALLAHSGGLKDGGHPAARALDAIQSLGRRRSFARTDRNGQVRIDLTAKPLRLEIGRGQLDDFQVNPRPRDEIQSQASAAGVPAKITWRETQGECIEVLVSVPRQRTQVTLTIDVKPDALGGTSLVQAHDPSSPLPEPISPFTLGGGRPFPRLLFVTSRTALAANIGPAAVEAALAAVRAAGGDVLDDLPLGVTVQEAARRTHHALRERDYAGVVLLGGYDVVPSARLAVVSDDLRLEVEPVMTDADDFTVWSDSIYADNNNDSFAEYPISRVPDAKSRKTFLGALGAGRPDPTATKFCLRNASRPFARTIFREIPGKGAEYISGPTDVSATLRTRDKISGHIYLMLHGSDTDGSALWGEAPEDRRYLEALHVSCLPGACSGLVFSGACWGALTVTRRAATQPLDRLPQSKSPDQSLVLAALRAGCVAFVGCTGSHYSPPPPSRRTDVAGVPMHRYFWRYVAKGKPPAEALFYAKRDYADCLPSQKDPVDEAIAQKTLRQFTCLGLGW